MEHTFEFDGVMYTWRRGTIRDAQVRKVITNKILKACGWDGQHAIPDEDNRGVFVYAEALAHLNPVQASWWRSAGDTPESLAEGYQDFMSMDEDLYTLLEKADSAVVPEKKMNGKPSKT